MDKYWWLLVCLVCLSTAAVGQKSKRRASGFTASQWYIGISSGVNQLQPRIQTSFSEIDYWGTENFETKEYASSDQPAGYQLGLVTIFSPFRALQLAVNPSYGRHRWGYRTKYTWADLESDNFAYDQTYQHQFTIHYLQFPLLTRYVIQSKRWKPFVQAGIQYQIRMDATKLLESTGTDYSSGSPISLTPEFQSTTAVNLFKKSQWSAKAGGGFYYHFTGCMAGFELNYYYGLSTIVNDQMRYSAIRNFQGLGNVLDDLRLTGKEITFQLVFPMKYLTKSFTPVVM